MSGIRLTLRDIPPELHARVKVEAADNLRTLSAEIIARLRASFANAKGRRRSK